MDQVQAAERAEKEYERLLVDKNVSKKIVNQPGFREQFLHRLSMMEMPYEVSINNGVPQVELNFKSDTLNYGICVGYSEHKTITFGLEKYGDHQFLCVREMADSVGRIPARDYGKQDAFIGNHHYKLDVFDNYGAEVGHTWVGVFDSKGQFTFSPIPLLNQPEITINDAISGQKPVSFNNSSYDCYRYRIESFGRSNSSLGSANFTMIDYDRGNSDSMIEETAIVPLDVQYPDTMRFSKYLVKYKNGNAYDENGSELSREEVATLCKNYQNYYESKTLPGYSDSDSNEISQMLSDNGSMIGEEVRVSSYS